MNIPSCKDMLQASFPATCEVRVTRRKVGVARNRTSSARTHVCGRQRHGQKLQGLYMLCCRSCVKSWGLNSSVGVEMGQNWERHENNTDRGTWRDVTWRHSVLWRTDGRTDCQQKYLAFSFSNAVHKYKHTTTFLPLSNVLPRTEVVICKKR